MASPFEKFQKIINNIKSAWEAKQFAKQSTLLRTLIDNLPDYIYFKDISSRFIIANKPTLRIMKCKTHEEVVGKTDFDFYDKEFAQKYFADEQEIIHTGRSRLDIEEYTPDEYGNIGIYSTSKVLLRDKSGKIIGLVGIGRDITKFKKAEEILKRDQEMLEKIVQDRSRQLLQAQIDLERSKRLSDIGALAMTVAHELRNPLVAIKMSIHNMKPKIKSVPESERYIHNIETKIEESDDIINNLLFYSKIRPPREGYIKVLEVLEECIDMTTKQMKKNGIIIKSIESLNDVSIEADIIQIKEVFNNLLNNAMDALPDEGGRIKVTAKVEGNQVKIVIEDNGSGINQEAMEKIFDPFFTTKAKGTGLGLSVCHQIIKMHNGNIEVQSHLGEGTAFVVTLPKDRKNKI